VLGYGSFDEYCQYLRAGDSAAERQTAIDLLTTNETYFFREPNHFTQLGAFVTTRFGNRSLRVWSAACSSGEEAYSIAMVLLDRRPDGAWQLLASDLSFQVLERARLGIFPLQRIEHFPAAYLKRFCLRGKGAYEGTLRVVDEVRARVQFVQHNLLDDAISLGTFDVIFLRNVLIYFDVATKKTVLRNVARLLRPDAWLFLGAAETTIGIDDNYERVATGRTSAYRVRSAVPAGTARRG
jgi:chemotaxis protein methyltransferase CheR